MLKTFKLGGIHPKGEKLTASMAIQPLPLPKEVVLPIAQHIGAPATVVVKKGDLVKTGSVIARASGPVSSNLHSPVSGKVIKIEESLDASGYKKTSVIIETEGDFWEESISRDRLLTNLDSLSSTEILEKIREAGIVGMGGASFPTHVKLEIPAGMKVDTLLINGVECEPFLTSDHRLMLEHGEEILKGTTLLMKVLDVKKAFIGIEINKPDAILHLNKLVKNHPGIEVEALQIKYPQGSEKQLIQAMTGRLIASGALPASVGVIVQNVATAYAVYEAIAMNKPLIERVVTVTGKGLSNPGNFLVRIGTPIIDLIKAAGGLPENTGKVIIGGPMMGKAIANLNIPVTKGMSGIVLLPVESSARLEDVPCIRCARCVEGCPMNLEPYLLMALAEKGLWERAEASHITDCMECGSCSYTCPSCRPVLDHIRSGKSQVGKIIRARTNKASTEIKPSN
jgi:electron transport complex protein RnfC